VLIDRDRQFFLGVFLANDIIIEEFFDLYGLRERRATRGGFLLLIIGNDLVANINALVADVNSRAGNQLLDFVL
jgi:hypothetical protein